MLRRRYYPRGEIPLAFEYTVLLVNRWCAKKLRGRSKWRELIPMKPARARIQLSEPPARQTMGKITAFLYRKRPALAGLVLSEATVNPILF